MASRAEGRSPAQMFALIVGAVYVLIGLAGLFFTDDIVGGQTEDKLTFFHINHLHNVVHLLLGAVWLAASRRHDWAKPANAALGATLLLVALLGFLLPDLMQDLLNIRGAGDPDNFLHLVTGAASLYFGTAGAGEPMRSTATA